MSEPSGFFLAVEGGEGAGKTTLIGGLADHYEALGYSVTVTSDPLGCELGRHVAELPRGSHGASDPVIEMLLLTAARRQLIETIIRPAMAAGHIVLCERYVHSMLVQQSIFADNVADMPLRMHAEACGDLWPHITILLDAHPSVTLSRVRPDLIGRVVEQAALPVYTAVADAFRRTMRYTPDGDYGILNANSLPAVVLAEAIDMIAVNDHFERYVAGRPVWTRRKIASA